jgi:2-haloacid dehalogenase
MTQPVIVWDPGNVLVDWSPRYLYNKIFERAGERDRLLENICNDAWHKQQDAGRPVATATEELVKKYPDLLHPIKAFYARRKQMFQGSIEGSVGILFKSPGQLSRDLTIRGLLP